MSARTGQRKKVYPSKHALYKDAISNDDIKQMFSKQTVRARGDGRLQPEGNEHKKTSRKRSPEETFTRGRGCLPSDYSVCNNNVTHTADDRKMPVAGDKQNGTERPVQGTDGKRNFQEMPIEECRQIYRNEIHTLWQEVEDFRITCQKEMSRQRTLLDEHRRSCEEAIKGKNSLARAPDVSEDRDYAKELSVLKENMHSLEEKQKLLDKEQDLVEREEHLSKRHEKLKEYEKDVEEAEALLDKRQHIARRRSQVVETLNHDLLIMKQDLTESLQSAESQMESSETNKTDVSNEPSEHSLSDVSTVTNSPETSCKARRNWHLARRHLIDKVALLETTVQRYRTQVASSSATITAKDMVISRLQKESIEMRDELVLKEKRIKQLESQLALSIEEKTRSESKLDMLLEELQNIDLSATAKVLPSPGKSPTKRITTNKRKLLKKQQSVFSFLTHHGSDKQEMSSSPGLHRRRTWGDNESAKKGHDTPQKTSPNHAKPDEAVSENGNLQKDSDNLNFNDLESKDDTYNLADFQDELGSKACAVM